MAVYTHLNAGQIARYAGWFGFTADRFRGVPGGTINTIYALSSGKKKYILRLLENRSRTDALFEDALLCHLRAQGLSVPIMLNSSRYGRVVSLDARQHLSIFEWMPGREIAPFELQPQHTEQVGRYIGKLHRATPSLRRRRRNRFSPQHIDRKLSVCERFVRKAGSREMVKDAQILRRELERFQWPERLPAGIVHSDLFVDNAFFSRGRLSGVIDYEMACNAPFIYDLAVALLDWCFEHDRFVRPRARALLDGYQRERGLTVPERAGLFAMCRFVAARYATTRLHDFEVIAVPEEDRTYKDYRHYMARLAALRGLGARGLRELADSTVSSR